MKSKLIVLITFGALLPVISLAQESKNKTFFGNKHGKWQNVDSNGVIQETMYYNLFGKLKGEYIRHYENGGIAVVGSYKKNKQSGEWHAFDRSQKLTEIIVLDRNKNIPSVEWIFLSEADSFSMNLNTGLRKYYHSNGQILATGVYKNAHKKGLWQVFYANGNSYCTGQLKNNKRKGKWLFYYENGNIERKIKYKHGVEVGSVEFFDKNGQKSQINSLNRNGEIKKTTYLTQRIEQEAAESEFLDFYITNMKGKHVSDYSAGDSLYFVIKTVNKVGDAMDLEISDNGEDFEAIKLDDVNLYNVKIKNYVLKNDVDKILAVPQRLSLLQCNRKQRYNFRGK